VLLGICFGDLFVCGGGNFTVDGYLQDFKGFQVRGKKKKKKKNDKKNIPMSASEIHFSYMLFVYHSSVLCV